MFNSKKIKALEKRIADLEKKVQSQLVTKCEMRIDGKELNRLIQERLQEHL